MKTPQDDAERLAQVAAQIRATAAILLNSAGFRGTLKVHLHQAALPGPPVYRFSLDGVLCGEDAGPMGGGGGDE